MEENYLPENISNMGETFLFWEKDAWKDFRP
jgi:hypothetical protein